MAWTRTNMSNLVAIGDEVVKVIKIDEKGRVDASMRALLLVLQNLNVMKKAKSRETSPSTRHHKDPKQKNFRETPKIQNKKEKCMGWWRRNHWYRKENDQRPRTAGGFAA